MTRHLKILRLIPALLLVSCFRFAAFASDLPPPEDPLLTPDFEQVVDAAAIDRRDERDYLRETGEPFTGIVEARHDNGRMAMRRSTVEGYVQGVWIEWYPTGTVRFYSEWRGGKGDGLWLYFHETGEISERVMVTRDVFHGPVEGWTKDGDKAFSGIMDNGERQPAPSTD